MRVIAAAETDAGICKPINQDGYCIKIAQTPAGQVALAAVCDGMGGANGGRAVSTLATQTMLRYFDHSLRTIENGEEKAIDTSIFSNLHPTELPVEDAKENEDETH